jgi:AcrR family transcriptional regulator
VRHRHLRSEEPGTVSATLNGVPGRTDSPLVEAGPPRRRADAERNERAIIDAAADVIWRAPGATIGEIATASGLGRATIYRHFASRDDLLRAIARQGFEQTSAALREARPDDGTAVEALLRMIDATVRPGNVCMLLLRDLPEPVASEAEKAEMLSPVVQALARGVAAGELRADLDIPWTVRAIGALYEVAMQSLADGSTTQEEAQRLMAATILDGLVARA